MNENEYMNMLYNFNDAFDQNKKLLITWSNGLSIICSSITGVYETDAEVEDDEEYIGEYAVAVGDVKILEGGIDDSILIYDDSIEICLINIPEKICSEDGNFLRLM